MSPKKVCSICLSLILIALPFVGCSTETATGSAPVGTSSSTAATPASSNSEISSAASTEPVTFRLMSSTLVGDPDGTIEKQTITDFEAQNPNIKIEQMPINANEIHTKLVAMITANDTPDIFTNFTSNMVAYDEMGALADLNTLFDQEYLSGFLPSVLEECKYQGKLLMVPYSCIPTALLYRQDWADEAGLSPPKTWDEFTDFIAKLTTSDRHGFAMMGANNTSAEGRFIVCLRNFGIKELINESGEWKTQLNTPEGIQLLNYYYQWPNVDKSVPPGCGEISHGSAITLIATEKAACMIGGPHSLASIIIENPSLDGKIGVTTIPTLNNAPSQTTAGIDALSVAESSKAKEAVAEYIKFRLSAAEYTKYNAVTNRIATRTEVADEISANRPELKAFVDAMENTFQRDQVAFVAELDQVIAKYMNALATGLETDAAKVAAELEAEIATVIAKY